MSLPIPAGPDIAGKTCPGCRIPIQAGAAVTVCPNCKNPHHALCWQKANGCAVYGCAQRAATVTPRQPDRQVAACPKCGYIYGPMETTCRRCAMGGGVMRTQMARQPYQSSGASPWAILLIVLIVLGIAGGIGYLALSKKEGSILLVYKFTPGQIDRYRFTMDMKMQMPKMPVGPSNMDMRMTAAMVQKVLSVDSDGAAKVETTIKDMTVTSPSIPIGAMPPLPDETIVSVISRTGREVVKDSSAADAVARLGMGMPGIGQVGRGAMLPECGVNVGDTWSETLKGPQGIELRITSKLVSASELVGARKTHKIEQTYDCDLDMDDMTKNTGTPMPRGMSATGKMTGSGTVNFSQDEGRVVRQDVNLKADITLGSGGLLGSSAKINMDMKLLMELAD